jgi:hypothetical protein
MVQPLLHTICKVEPLRVALPKYSTHEDTEELLRLSSVAPSTSASLANIGATSWETISPALAMWAFDMSGYIRPLSRIGRL